MPNKAVKYSNRGSMTIEASILFSLIFFCIIALIYAGLLLYQQAYLQSLVDRTAQMGALSWNSPKRDMYIGRITESDLNNKDLYWRIVDSSKGDKEKKIINFISSHIGTFGLLRAKSQDMTARVDNCAIYNKLNVKATQTYYLPVGKLLRIFGLDETFAISAEGEAIIQEPAEFVRNTDFILDTGKKLDRKTGGHIQTSGQSISTQISEMLDKAMELLGKD